MESSFLVGLIEGQMIFTGTEERKKLSDDTIKQLWAGYSHLGHNSVLQTEETTSLCKAIEVAIKQRSRKRK